MIDAGAGPAAGSQIDPIQDECRLTRYEASAWLAAHGIRMKPATLARLFSTGGDGPPCRHIRGKPYYPLEVLETWARGQITDLRTSAPPKKARRRAL